MSIYILKSNSPILQFVFLRIHLKNSEASFYTRTAHSNKIHKFISTKCTTNLSQAAPLSAFFSRKDTGGYKRQLSWVPQPQCLFELLLRVHEVAVPVNLNIGIKSSVYMYTVCTVQCSLKLCSMHEQY